MSQSNRFESSDSICQDSETVQCLVQTALLNRWRVEHEREFEVGVAGKFSPLIACKGKYFTDVTPGNDLIMMKVGLVTPNYQFQPFRFIAFSWSKTPPWLIEASTDWRSTQFPQSQEKMFMWRRILLDPTKLAA